MTRSTHTLYTAADFTRDEIARANVLAVAVIDEGRQICKQCGSDEEELRKWPTCEHVTAHRMYEKSFMTDPVFPNHARIPTKPLVIHRSELVPKTVDVEDIRDRFYIEDGDEDDWGCSFCRNDGKLVNGRCPKCDAEYPDE